MCIILTADLISCVEFNHDGELLATGDKGGRVVIFQRDPMVNKFNFIMPLIVNIQNYNFNQYF